MKRFNTKKDLLRYLGKNEDDRKLVTRMIERGEVRLENRMYVIEEESSSSPSSPSSNDTDLANDLANRLSNDLEYLNREYEKLEGLLDYSLRKCYDMMKKKGLVGSEDTYDDFYTRITEGYSARGVSNTKSVAHTTETNVAHATGSDLNSVIQKFGISKASDFIS